MVLTAVGAIRMLIPLEQAVSDASRSHGSRITIKRISVMSSIA